MVSFGLSRGWGALVEVGPACGRAETGAGEAQPPDPGRQAEIWRAMIVVSSYAVWLAATAVISAWS